jgi:hypothetical protein
MATKLVNRPAAVKREVREGYMREEEKRMEENERECEKDC